MLVRDRLCESAAGLECLLVARDSAEFEDVWEQHGLNRVGWEALALARRADSATLAPVLTEVDHRLLALLERCRAFLDPHVVTFRIPELERWQHAAAAALVGARWGAAGLKTVIADLAAPLGRRYFAFLALAQRHPPGAWPVFARYLEAPGAHHAFLAGDTIRTLAGLVAGVDGVDVVICPPFTALAAAIEAAKGSCVAIGAQDCYWEKEGAFTGGWPCPCSPTSAAATASWATPSSASSSARPTPPWTRRSRRPGARPRLHRLRGRDPRRAGSRADLCRAGAAGAQRARPAPDVAAPRCRLRAGLGHRHREDGHPAQAQEAHAFIRGVVAQAANPAAAQAWDRVKDLGPLREKLADYRARIRVVLPRMSAAHPELILIASMFHHYRG